MFERPAGHRLCAFAVRARMSVLGALVFIVAPGCTDDSAEATGTGNGMGTGTTSGEDSGGEISHGPGNQTSSTTGIASTSGSSSDDSTEASSTSSAGTVTGETMTGAGETDGTTTETEGEASGSDELDTESESSEVESGESSGEGSSETGNDCRMGEIECQGACIDPNVDAEFCGAQGDCLGMHAGDRCSSDELCVEGVCQCQPMCGTRVCGLDPVCGMSCGGCSDDELCVDGQCELNRAPEVTITMPMVDSGPNDLEYYFDGIDKETGLHYTDVELVARAEDPEDGPLTGDAIVWFSDQVELQGPELGRGARVSVRLYSDDAFGKLHSITARATDGHGASGDSSPRRIIIWSLAR